jgi:hypothetical protein
LDPPLNVAFVQRSGLETWEDVDDATTAVATEFNSASCECEESVIFAATNVVTWVEVSATLANDDFACINNLTTEALYAKTLCIRIATVAGAGRTFLMCHVVLPTFLR